MNEKKLKIEEERKILKEMENLRKIEKNKERII